MIEAIRIPADASKPLEDLHVPEEHSLPTLQRAVGGLIEPMLTTEDHTLYANEEAAFAAAPVPNFRATDHAMRWKPWFAVRPILGDCVLVGFDPRRGEHTATIPDAARRRIELIDKEARGA